MRMSCTTYAKLIPDKWHLSDAWGCGISKGSWFGGLLGVGALSLHISIGPGSHPALANLLPHWTEVCDLPNLDPADARPAINRPNSHPHLRPCGTRGKHPQIPHQRIGSHPLDRAEGAILQLRPKLDIQFSG